MNILMGAIIKKVAKSKGLTPKTFAQLINVHPKSVPNIYKRTNFRTDLLEIISEALDYDFVNHLYENEPLRSLKKKESDDLKEQIKVLKKSLEESDEKIKELKNTITVEREMFKLLKKK